MNILITGGSGYLGSVLTTRLIADGHQVTVYDNLKYKQNSLVDLAHHDNFNFIYGDVRNTTDLLSEVKKADVIFPLAAIVGFPACEKDKHLASQTNYEQIKTIDSNLSSDQMLILPNTNSGYGIGETGMYCDETSPLNPITHYGKTKVDAEKVILDSQKGISLRLATVFGVSPRMRMDLLVNFFTYKAMTDEYIILFEQNFKRNYIHIQDVASAFIFMMNNFDKYNGEAFNVGLSDANISKAELCDKIKEFLPKFVVSSNEYFSDPDQRDYIVSNDKIENTGWSPKFSLDAGIKELIKAYTIISNTHNEFTNL